MTVAPCGSVAVMVATDWVATVDVVIVKVAVVAPAGIVTLSGATAAAKLLLRVMTMPPEGDGDFKVIVPVEGLPAMTDVGLTVSLVIDGAFTVRVAVSELEYNVAVITGEAGLGTPMVEIVKVTEEDPAGTVTVAGTDAHERLLDNATFKPPFGAGAPTVSVPDDEVKPVTTLGLSVKLSKLGAFKVSDVESEAEERLAEILAVVCDGTT